MIRICTLLGLALSPAAIALGAGTAPGAPSGQPSAVSFEGSLKTASGQEPLEAARVTFVPGKSGQAGLFVQDARLAYPTAASYDAKRGTVEMWVKRQWEETESPTDRILWLLQTDEGQDNLTYLGFRGTGAEGHVYFANAGGVDGVRVPLEWKKDAWRHLMACWDESLRIRALYIDGTFRDAQPYTRAMPARQTAFHLGYSPNTGLGAMAAIDEFKIHSAIAPADFLENVRMAEADLRARAAEAALVKRLGETYSLDRVEKERIEVKAEDLVGLPTAFTQRVPIQACCHPDIVMVHPDLSITLGRSSDSLALGLALGDEAALPDMYQVTRRLRDGYLPIVESRYSAGSLAVEQTAFCILPDDEDVTSGREEQYAVVRLKITNTSKRSVDSGLLLMVGKANGTQRTNYRPFVPSPARWRAETLKWKTDGESLVSDGRVLLAYRTDGAMPAAFHPVIDLPPGKQGNSEPIRNSLRFPLRLEPAEARTIDLVVAGTSALYPAASRERMAAQRFEPSLARAEAHWNRLLAPAMRLITPDEKINEVYKAMILSSLQNHHKTPDRPWREPDQSCFLSPGVWPWEFSQQAVPLASIGYQAELDPSLRFFTERQVGVGPHAASRGPQGDLDSIEGCYVGNCGIYWMCETGAVLHAMAARYLYSRDAEWLRQNRPSILAAWRFIQKARAQTRTVSEDGRRPPGYGLLPPGRATDAGELEHTVGFSDNYTWEGLAAMAEAFQKAGLAEAEQMAADVEEYRQCILEAVQRSQYVDPETGLTIIPNFLTRKGAAHGGNAFDTRYSLAMWQTGLLKATDPRFDAAFQWQQRKGGFLMGLVFPFPIGSTCWYVNSIEKGKYMNHLARGELEKALLVFYTNLVYSMSQDCYQTVERIKLDQPNFSPFQQNASGNGRIIEMCRRMVIDEQDADTLWLLRGCPRRWFAPGKTIAVENAPTRFGKMAIHTQSDGRTIRVEIEAPAWEPPRQMRVAVRHPERRALKSATANGQQCSVEGDAVILPSPRGKLKLVCTFE